MEFNSILFVNKELGKELEAGANLQNGGLL